MRFLDKVDVTNYSKHNSITSEEIENALANPNDFVNYPKRHGANFYNHYKEDIALMAEMGLKYLECLFHGSVFFLTLMMNSQTKKA